MLVMVICFIILKGPPALGIETHMNNTELLTEIMDLKVENECLKNQVLALKNALIENDMEINSKISSMNSSVRTDVLKYFKRKYPNMFPKNEPFVPDSERVKSS